jgi:DNA-binding GntR family transcriptional regulator
MATGRDKKLTILVTDEERTMLEAIAQGDGLTASDVVRQFIRRTHAQRFPAPKLTPGQLRETVKQRERGRRAKVGK